MHTFLQVKHCPNADISPCPLGDGGETWSKYPLHWPNITEGAEADHLSVHSGLYATSLGDALNASAASPDAGHTILGKLATQQFGESDVSLSGAT